MHFHLQLQKKHSSFQLTTEKTEFKMKYFHQGDECSAKNHTRVNAARKAIEDHSNI
jgi:hypothetical protein